MRDKLMKFGILMSILFLAGALLFCGFSPGTSAASVVNLEICVMDADGSNQINLTQNPADDTSPAWSPDGKKIAFLSNGHIYIMNADGRSVIRLTEEGGRDPVWSPDGKKIAFESWREFIVVNADGSNMIRPLRSGLGEGTHLSWSPDSRKIAFDSRVPHEKYYDPDARSNIWIINTDGSDLIKLINLPTIPYKYRAEFPA